MSPPPDVELSGASISTFPEVEIMDNDIISVEVANTNTLASWAVTVQQSNDPSATSRQFQDISNATVTLHGDTAHIEAIRVSARWVRLIARHGTAITDSFRWNINKANILLEENDSYSRD